MSRTIAEYEELIDGLETSAASNPRWYRRKVVALAILGFTYIGFVVTLASVGLLALAAMVIAVPGFVTIKHVLEPESIFSFLTRKVDLRACGLVSGSKLRE